MAEEATTEQIEGTPTEGAGAAGTIEQPTGASEGTEGTAPDAEGTPTPQELADFRNAGDWRKASTQRDQQLAEERRVFDQERTDFDVERRVVAESQARQDASAREQADQAATSRLAGLQETDPEEYRFQKIQLEQSQHAERVAATLAEYKATVQKDRDTLAERVAQVEERELRASEAQTLRTARTIADTNSLGSKGSHLIVVVARAMADELGVPVTEEVMGQAAQYIQKELVAPAMQAKAAATAGKVAETIAPAPAGGAAGLPGGGVEQKQNDRGFDDMTDLNAEVDEWHKVAAATRGGPQ